MCDSQLRGLAMASVKAEMISLLGKLKMEADTAMETIRKLPDDTSADTADRLLTSLNGAAGVIEDMAARAKVVEMLCIGGDKHHDTR